MAAFEDGLYKKCFFPGEGGCWGGQLHPEDHWVGSNQVIGTLVGPPPPIFLASQPSTRSIHFMGEEVHHDFMIFETNNFYIP